NCVRDGAEEEEVEQQPTRHRQTAVDQRCNKECEKPDECGQIAQRLKPAPFRAEVLWADTELAWSGEIAVGIGVCCSTLVSCAAVACRIAGARWITGAHGNLRHACLPLAATVQRVAAGRLAVPGRLAASGRLTATGRWVSWIARPAEVSVPLRVVSLA